MPPRVSGISRFSIRAGGAWLPSLHTKRATARAARGEPRNMRRNRSPATTQWSGRPGTPASIFTRPGPAQGSGGTITFPHAQIGHEEVRPLTLARAEEEAGRKVKRGIQRQSVRDTECRHRLLRFVQEVDANDRRPGQHGHIEVPVHVEDDAVPASLGSETLPTAIRALPGASSKARAARHCRPATPGSAAPCPSPCSSRRGCHGSRRCRWLRSGRLSQRAGSCEERVSQAQFRLSPARDAPDAALSAIRRR